MDITLNNPEKLQSVLQFVTKNAVKYIKTPRKEGELAVLDTYIIDDVNYDTEEYDAFKGGLIVFDPDPTTATEYHLQIEYSQTFARMGGAPMWVSLLWKPAEEPTTLPAVFTQPPAVSGVSTTDLNSYTIGSASDDEMDFPEVTETPIIPSPATYEVFYSDYLSSNGVLVSVATGSTNTFAIVATKPVPAGTTFHGYIYYTAGTGSPQVTLTNGSVSTVNAIPYDGYYEIIAGISVTTVSDTAPSGTIATATSSDYFTMHQSMIFATNPLPAS